MGACGVHRSPNAGLDNTPDGAPCHALLAVSSDASVAALSLDTGACISECVRSPPSLPGFSLPAVPAVPTCLPSALTAVEQFSLTCSMKFRAPVWQGKRQSGSHPCVQHGEPPCPGVTCAGKHGELKPKNRSMGLYIEPLDEEYQPLWLSAGAP